MLSILPTLWIILYIVARKNALLEFKSVVITTISMGRGVLVTNFILSPFIFCFSLISFELFSTFILTRYCYLTLKQAFIVLTLYGVANILITTIWNAITITPKWRRLTP